MTLTRPSSEGMVSRTRPLADAPDLLAALGHDGFAWLHDGGGLATSGVAARIRVGPGPDRFSAAADEVAELLAAVDVDDPLRAPGTGPVAVGALPFHAGAEAELVVPAVVVGCTPQGRAWVTETAADDDFRATDSGRSTPPGRVSAAIDAGASREAWTTAVRGALERIAAGPLAKVVLAREVVVESDAPFDRQRVLHHLRSTHPSSFTYAAGGFVGASPELLVRRRGGRVVSRPMAGTAPRGITTADDERLAAGLASSAKEAEEHALVVEAVRAALEPVCREVMAEAGPELVRLSTLTHLATTVAGHLADPAPSALALAGILHPTPAVGGIPRAEALAAIAELESFDRGLYAGPVGWVDGRGDGDWAVALRCADLAGTRARLVAGAGIVAESDPDAEWAETEAKLGPMLGALARA
ncbi:MAG TPA: isochorismate synthase [Acidimicrobiales bacterium]|nr:isochorismate synthase [Acidimicrobiales bacterium]